MNARAVKHFPAPIASDPVPVPEPLPVSETHPLARLGAADEEDMAMETAEARAEVRFWQSVFTRILNAEHGGRLATIQREARALEACANSKMAIPWKALEKRYEKFRAAAKKRDRYWYRTMMDRRRHKAPKQFVLPQLTRRWIKNLYGDYPRQGAAKRIHEKMLSMWRLWRAGDETQKIPGYRVPPVGSRYNSGLPQGWSIDTIRKLRPPRSVLSIVHVGPKYGSAYGAKIRHTRCDGAGNVLPFGSVLFFDDAWHDVDVHYVGFSKKPVRPVSFYAMEALTTYRDCLIKPRFFSEDEGKAKNLNETDFFWFLMHVLQTWGWNAQHGTTLIMEHGTANARIDEVLRAVTDKKVSIGRSDLYGDPAVRQLLFQCEGGGNFRFKAPLEGSFQMDHNHRAHVAGYLGSSPKDKPEEHLGLCKYHDSLIARIDSMTPEEFGRLLLPKLHIADYSRFAYALNDALNKREQHEIEKWEQCGFVDFRWRLDAGSDQWATREAWEALTPEARQAYGMLLRSNPELCDAPRMSPHAAFHRELARAKAAGVQRTLTDTQLAAVAPEKLWRAAKVTGDGEFVIRDAQTMEGRDAIRFRSIAENPQGHDILLKRGQFYRVLMNPLMPDRLQVADEAGRYIGRVWNVDPFLRTDGDGLERQMADVARDRGAVVQEVAAITQRKAAERQRQKRHNDAVIAESERRESDAEDATRERLRKAAAARRKRRGED